MHLPKWILAITLVGLRLAAASAAAEPRAATAAIDAAYLDDIRPLLKRLCLDCHSTEKSKGDLDLEQFGRATDARLQPQIWQNVAEQLALREMPPKEKPQPNAAEFDRLTTWVDALLRDVALSTAGDPGPVVLRRLSNAEFTSSIRDLTGIESLDPAREFPVDGASGEGFMNAGSGLVMSPTLLTKYLDAARQVSQHAVLLPDGFRFASSTSRRDQTDEIVGRIRDFYRRYTDPRGSTRVNLQGLVWDTNEGGRPPVDRYLAALDASETALASESTTYDEIARRFNLSPKYLETLRRTLASHRAAPILNPARSLWARPSRDSKSTADEIAEWQKALWKFTSVGHIGKVGGPKAWMEPVDPRVTRQDFRVPLSAVSQDRPFVTVRLSASDAGDGSRDDIVLWERPRLVAQGRPDLLLRDLRWVARDLEAGRSNAIASTAACLRAAAEAEQAPRPDDLSVAQLATKHGVAPSLLQAWLDVLGVGTGGAAPILNLFTNRIESTAGYAFVQGWGKGETPNVIANRSDMHVRVPGNLRAHGVAMHPSPTLHVAVAWKAPVAGNFRAELVVTHAHPECGNGVTWSLEARRGTTRHRLASGIAQGGKPARPNPVQVSKLRPGDVLEVLIGPRDGNHSCDLSAIDLAIHEIVEPSETAKARSWNLADDVSNDILAGNPHSDRYGNSAVWFFHTEPVSAEGTASPALPPESLLARWKSEADLDTRHRIASQVQLLLEGPAPAPPETPDSRLRRLLLAPSGPVLSSVLASASQPRSTALPEMSSVADPHAYGLDPAYFGRHPHGDAAVDVASLCLQAPGTLEFRIPSELAAGADLVVSGTLHDSAGPDACVQFQASLLDPSQDRSRDAALRRHPLPSVPFVARDNSLAATRLRNAFDEFRSVFPAALAYTRIVPVDEVVTLTLFYREDDALQRLMLNDAEISNLNRLWDDLHFVAQDALTLVDAYAQLMEYATQDADPKVFEPLRIPIQNRATAFRKQLVAAEPRHLDALVDFASKVFRRPLRPTEPPQIRALYQKLRSQDLSHEDAFRMTLARLLVSPDFLYRAEEPPPGPDPKPVSDWELASRLSYFLWSSVPDATLRAAAAEGRLSQPDVLLEQTRRMLRDPRVRRLAIDFGCQWLHVRDFDQLDEKSERHFPEFTRIRSAMYEEVIQFFTDFFSKDRSVRSLMDGDHMFLNADLAAFYGVPGVSGPEWRRVDRAQTYQRGGILGFGATLSRQSGASRTSPILRGNWISEVLLGEKLPKPPKDVPRLPEDEAATKGLTVRQLVERHSEDPRCAGCHVRIDPYGFALEAYDAIGRHRARDLADRPIVTTTKTGDGSTLDGFHDLREYLGGKRGDALTRQFCRKLLGYALGRGVQLSDTPLMDEMMKALAAHQHRVGSAVETLVLSRQFREIRGRDSTLHATAPTETPSP